MPGNRGPVTRLSPRSIRARRRGLSPAAAPRTAPRFCGQPCRHRGVLNRRKKQFRRRNRFYALALIHSVFAFIARRIATCPSRPPMRGQLRVSQ